MTKFTTQLLTDETKEKLLLTNNENHICFANGEEEIYLNAMIDQSMERRESLIETFNKSVIAFARNYPEY